MVELQARGGQAGHQDQRGAGCRAESPGRRSQRKATGCPGQHDEYADQGQVGVAVDQGLPADLDQADNRTFILNIMRWLTKEL